MLRKMTPEKSKVADAMIFCIEHAEASDEIIDFVTESLNSVKTCIPKKVFYYDLFSFYKTMTEYYNTCYFTITTPARLGKIKDQVRLGEIC